MTAQYHSELKITQLHSNELDTIFALQEKILHSLADSHMFHPDTREEIASYFDNGFILGAYLQDSLIAYRIVTFPDKERSLTRYVEELPQSNLQCAHLETCVVHPEYRGRKLQYHLTRHSLDILNQHDAIDLICCTVHPGNKASLKNLTRLGFKVKCLTILYGSKERFVLYKRKPFLYPENKIQIHSQTSKE